jgi:8-oxo-dGTP pyrophosphatase MutT (NUDIX family)
MPDATLRAALSEEANRVHGKARDARQASDMAGQPLPRLRPKDAATLIVLDRSGADIRILMGKRHQNHKFMPNMFVFPGGRAERTDAAIPVASELLPDVVRALLARTTRGTEARARRLALAAIRETFEETGLVIGLPGERSNPASSRALQPDGPWGAFLATGHLPDLASIRFLARAVTPPGRTKRFDTRFFVVDAGAIRHTVGEIVGPDSELTELAWLTMAETADLPLPAITRVVLDELRLALEAGWPQKPVPLPFYYRRREIFQRELIG